MYQLGIILGTTYVYQKNLHLASACAPVPVLASEPAASGPAGSPVLVQVVIEGVDVC